MKYRKEIDGLRAFAVVPVIFFHAGFKPFSGGFVGVDVFFVISGYLITSIILTEKNQGNFTLIGFYERRVRRILPALFFVMLVCLPFAWLWMMPGDMQRFSQSVAAVSVFASNILFWRQSGYFDTANELKPLLHTWSLAVEEQFYVLFPLFLLITWRLGRRWTIASLALIAVISVALAHWASIHKPAAAFYLLPTRGFELMLGALVAFYMNDKPSTPATRPISELCAFFGLGLVGYAIFTFDDSTLFPSLYALVPTLGVVLLILFATPQTFVGKLLSYRWLVGMGLISYSAYLWHQPMFALARYRTFDQVDGPLLLFLSVLAVFFAYLSWRYIEQPFRNRQAFKARTVFSLGLIMSMSFFFLGAYGHYNGGFTGRFDPEIVQLLSQNTRSYSLALYRMGDCFLVLDGSQNYKDFSADCKETVSDDTASLIWGDSHAAALSVGLRSTMSNVAQYTASGCPPLVGLVITDDLVCKNVNDFVMQEVQRMQPKTIFIHANWSKYDQINRSSFIKATIAAIQNIAPSSKILVVGSVPQWSPNLQTAIRSKLISDRANILEYLPVPLLEGLRHIDEDLREAADSNGARFLSAIDSLCTENVCKAIAELDGKRDLTTWDNSHLTQAGSIFLSKKLLTQIAR